MDPSGKVALITGAAGDYGQAFSRALLAAGAQVTLSDKDEAAGNKVVSDLEKEFGKGKVIFVKADDTSYSGLEEVFKAAKSTFHRLDIVVNNPGNMLNASQTEIDLKLKASVLGTRFAYKYMGRATGDSGGLVVNVSPGNGLNPNPVSFPPSEQGKGSGFGPEFEKQYMDSPTGGSGMLVVDVQPPIGVNPNPPSKEGDPIVSVVGLIPESSPLEGEDDFQQTADDFGAVRQPVNSPEIVAEGLMRAIWEGTPGSVWVPNNGVFEALVH